MSDAINQTDPQPKDTRELLRTIQPLSDERRIEARERARALVVKAAGEMPKPEDFDSHTQSRYPNWMNWTINLLCLIVLVAAFLPSAIRLFFIGSTTFAQTITDAHAAIVAGYSIVIMAEISMVLFSIASVIVESHKPPQTDDAPTDAVAIVLRFVANIDSVKLLLIFSQIVATAIALVGNAQVSLKDGHHTNPFAVIEAFSPSIVVFTTSYILKAQMLSTIERRYANTRAYQLALNAWKVATSQPDTDPRFRPALHNALKDFLREDNLRGAGATARREYMAGLVLQDWQRLVKRELMADEWYADPDAQTAPVSDQTTDRRQIDSRQRRSTNGVSDQTRQIDTRHPSDTRQMSYVDSASEQTTDIRQTRSGVGFAREASGVALAVEWLEANPDKWNLALREIGALVGVSKDTVAAAKRTINSRQEQPNE